MFWWNRHIWRNAAGGSTIQVSSKTSYTFGWPKLKNLARSCPYHLRAHCQIGGIIPLEPSIMIFWGTSSPTKETSASFFSRWSQHKCIQAYSYSCIVNIMQYIGFTRSYKSGWWLSHPSEKYEFVNWDHLRPNISGNKWCPKAPTRFIISNHMGCSINQESPFTNGTNFMVKIPFVKIVYSIFSTILKGVGSPKIILKWFVKNLILRWF